MHSIVIHSCNPRYLGAREKRITTWTNIAWCPTWKINLKRCKQIGDVAQMVEHLLNKGEVLSSISNIGKKIYIYTYRWTYMYVYICGKIYTFIHMDIYVCAYVCIHICVFLSVPFMQLDFYIFMMIHTYLIVFTYL
jgi:hypothetical protein